MPMRFSCLRQGALCVAAMSAMLHAGQAQAQAASQTGVAEVEILDQLTLVEVSGLDFGAIIPSNVAGNINIARNSGTCTAQGGVTLVGTNCQRGEFLITGPSGQQVRITLAAAPITLTHQSATATMVMDRVRLNGGRNKRLNAAGSRTFFVSGRLQVGVNQEPGIYDGIFDVTVEFR